MAVNLDDPAIYSVLDKGGMGEQMRGLPAQCRQAWEKAAEFELPRKYGDVDKVVILGMGGSAIGGDLLRGIAGNTCRPIIVVQREYDLPAYVDANTLVIASSYSGNTEETISAFKQALQTGCKKLVISTGGKLTELARQSNVPFFVIEHVSPPRAALGYSLMPLLAIMQNLGLLSAKIAGVEQALQALASRNLAWQEDSPVQRNQAKQLAATLEGKVAVVYGAGLLNDVARRWKTQINENSKAWAFFEAFPELNHNAVLGYRNPPYLAENMYVVLLRCPSLHPRTLIRYEVTAGILANNKIPYQFVDSPGGSLLEEMLSMVLLGDWISLYLSMLYGSDPSPIPEIDLLKKRLADSQ